LAECQIRQIITNLRQADLLPQGEGVGWPGFDSHGDILVECKRTACYCSFRIRFILAAKSAMR